MIAFQCIWWSKKSLCQRISWEKWTKDKYRFWQFSDSAQRIGVYTAADYIDIMQKLMDKWEIDKITGLTDEAEKREITWWNYRQEWLEFQKEWPFLKNLIFSNGWSQLEYSYKGLE
jgi:hypothetical protein